MITQTELYIYGAIVLGILLILFVVVEYCRRKWEPLVMEYD